MKKFKDLERNECYYSTGNGPDMECCAKKTLPDKNYCENHYFKIYIKGSLFNGAKKKFTFNTK